MCSNLDVGGTKVPIGADTCLEIFDLWQGMQALAHFLQSALMDGQTYRCVINLTVAFIPGCDS